MSNKRGRRNGKWHKEKQIRRLQTLRDELRSQSCKKEYVPLEKPIFAGWDISIGLTEQGKRRKDAHELEEILKVLKLDRGYFTRNIKFVREIRQGKHQLNVLYTTKHNSWHNDNLRRRHINYNEYHNLPVHLKNKFFKDRFYKYSSYGREYYCVEERFPWYECKLVITKSYYTHKVIYDTQAQSDYDKLNNKIWPDLLKIWGRGYRDDFKKTKKSAWKRGLKQIVVKQLTPDEVIDMEANLFPKTSDTRDYGWS